MAHKKQTGFTIIEIMITLVVAGVILVAVFMGIGQLRRNSRDAARTRFAASIPQQYLEFYKYNMSYPSNASQRQSFIDNYIPSISDPLSGDPYVLDFKDGKTDPPTDVPPLGTVYLMQYHWCNDSDSSDGTTNPVAGDLTSADQIVVWFGTEAGEYRCVDSH